MEMLSHNNQTLLLQGAKVTGNFVDGYYYIEENLFAKDADMLFKFCQYIDNEIGGASSRNIQQLFIAFTQPNNSWAQEIAQEIKTKIQSIRTLTA